MEDTIRFFKYEEVVKQQVNSPVIVCVDSPHGKICVDSKWEKGVEQLEKGVRKGKYLNLQRLAMDSSFPFLEGPGWYPFELVDERRQCEVSRIVCNAGGREKLGIYDDGTEKSVMAALALGMLGSNTIEAYYVPTSFVNDPSNYESVEF